MGGFRSAAVASILILPLSAVSAIVTGLAPVDVTADSEFGQSVSEVSDLNGDGHSDFVVGSPAEGVTGRAHVFNGATRSRLFLLSPADGADPVPSRFGNSVSGVPDLDNDGHGDILVADTVSVHIFSGREGTLIRRLTGFSTPQVIGTPDFDGDGGGDILLLYRGETLCRLALISGGTTNVLFEWWVNMNDTAEGVFDWIPDLDGDAVPDVLFGEPHYYGPEGYYQGHVLVYSGRTGTLLHTIDHPNPHVFGLFGASVAGLPDLTGDGRGEFVVGAPGNAHNLEDLYVGRVHVFDGATGNLLHSLLPLVQDRTYFFGHTISSVPDINGNGYADIAVCSSEYVPDSWWDDPISSGVFLFDGRTGDPLATLRSPSASPSDEFGESMKGIGDLNGDGFGDLLVSAPSFSWLENDLKPGGIWLYTNLYPYRPNISGPASPTNRFPIRFDVEFPSDPIGLTASSFTLTGGQMEGGLESVASKSYSLFVNPYSVGQVTCQLAAGEVLDTDSGLRNGVSEPERVIYDPLGPYTIRSPNPYIEETGFGTALCLVPDFTGDGVPDLAIGAPRENLEPLPQACGFVHLLDGATFVRVRTLSPPTPTHEGGFGSRVVALPGVDGSGHGRLLVRGGYGQTMWSDHPNTRVYLFDCATGSLLHTFSPPVLPDSFSFGHGLSAVPDVTGDGRDDIAISDEMGSQYAWDSPGQGVVHLFDGVTFTLIRTYTPNQRLNDTMFGFSVCGLDDLDGDGRGEIAIGAPRTVYPENPPDSPGHVYLFSGASTQTLNILSAPDSAKNRQYGYSLAAVPDVTGDGKPEILIGSPYFPYYEIGRLPAAYLYNPTGEAYIFELPFDPLNPPSYFAESVASVPDTTGDGFADLLVAAPRESFEANGNRYFKGGRVRLYNGRTGRLVRQLQPPASRVSTLYGTAVAGLPDRNGDGLGEILVQGGYAYAPGEPGAQHVYLYDGVNEWQIGIHEALLGRLPPAPEMDLDGNGFVDIADRLRLTLAGRRQ